jgi:hypothetical protein
LRSGAHSSDLVTHNPANRPFITILEVTRPARSSAFDPSTLTARTIKFGVMRNDCIFASRACRPAPRRSAHKLAAVDGRARSNTAGPVLHRTVALRSSQARIKVGSAVTLLEIKYPYSPLAANHRHFPALPKRPCVRGRGDLGKQSEDRRQALPPVDSGAARFDQCGRPGDLLAGC